MVQLRHSGIYVKNLEKMALFYKEVFCMYPICENVIQEDNLIHDIFKCESAKVMITKLITEQGKENGYDDMVELIQTILPVEKDKCAKTVNDNIYSVGVSHLAFGVEHISVTLEKLLQFGGKLDTRVHAMGNGNYCCFGRDLEGNFLEIIGREY